MSAPSTADLLSRINQLEATTKALADRQAIGDCLVRFCRGVNRLDKPLLLSVFHPDAIDDHGFFVGNREQFLSWIDSVYLELAYTQHYVMNYTMELEGTVAHTECYWLVVNKKKGTEAVILRGGRYIDRFEERRGVWAIARRLCLTEWNAAPGEFAFPREALDILAKSGVPTRDHSDPSYLRPFEIHRAFTNVKPQT